ncbi:hypothetical protein [Halomonas piscis]|uniref:hypothetical protein n=1 Tax=Halomonas piscis TaxID=3031727 RepID=UPI0028A0280A|nr:hypothetical protein [Halomonas piscis]
MKPTLRSCKTFSFPDGTLKDEDKRLVVWWYGPVIKNNQPESVPKIHIFFRTLDEHNNFGKYIRRTAALTHLGLLRIGSVWHRGVNKNRIIYEKKKFEVSFSENGWQIISLGDLVRSGRNLNTEFIDESYLPESKRYETFLIDFKLADGTRLLVPCIEFFARCYGSSSEVKRILATYRWEKVKKRLFKPLEATALPGTWPIKLTQQANKADAIFLAHILYDPYAELAAKRVYAQLEADFLSGHPYSLPKITPWFRGDAQLIAEGVSIDKGNSFLALRILGSSQPGGARIQREREQHIATAEDEENGGPMGLPSKKPPKIADIIDLTDDEEPDHGSSWLDIEEEPFIVLGKRRTVIDKWHERDTSTNRQNALKSGDDAALSTGEFYGSGKDIGKANLYASLKMESQGVLRDMWEALRYLQSLHPHCLYSVEWFTFDNGFCSYIEPKLIRFNAINSILSLSMSIKQWPYIDYDNFQLRGALVIRVTTEFKHIYIVEIQRRIKEKSHKSNILEEEPISGLCFILNDDADFESWLRDLLSEIRYKKGIFKRILGNCPGHAETFAHRKSKDDTVFCESAAKNALNKMK